MKQQVGQMKPERVRSPNLVVGEERQPPQRPIHMYWLSHAIVSFGQIIGEIARHECRTTQEPVLLDLDMVVPDETVAE